MPPSDFSDVEDIHLRNNNRGAVLANTFELYVDKKTKHILAKDLALCTRELDRYLSRIPLEERKLASDAMFNHLQKRGYRWRI